MTENSRDYRIHPTLILTIVVAFFAALPAHAAECANYATTRALRLR